MSNDWPRYASPARRCDRSRSIATIEALVAALAGVVIGFGLYFVTGPALVHVPFAGQPLEPGDLSIGWIDAAVAVIGIPSAAAVVARFALRRVQVSPLGVSRRVTPQPPRMFRVIPLVAGVAVLAYFVSAGRPGSSNGQIEGYVLGFLLIMFGLVLAGPWLTMQGAKFMARRTSRVSVLLAGRRLSDNPRGAFRAVSGLILAIFVTSVSVGVTLRSSPITARVRARRRARPSPISSRSTRTTRLPASRHPSCHHCVRYTVFAA